MDQTSTHNDRWKVYIVRCSDDSLYTGITTDLQRRLVEHNSTAKGAAYTRSRRPVQLAYCITCPDRSSATRQERNIKQMTRSAKEELLVQASDSREALRE